MNEKVSKELSSLRSKLNIPKSQFNSFGGYSYRSCEDILQSVKPLLEGALLTLTDEMIVLGTGESERFYVKATASYTYEGETIKSEAFARESFDRKGMDDSQITGAASSYARKYALNALFLLDDVKDADTMDNTQKQAKTASKPYTKPTTAATAEKPRASEPAKTAEGSHKDEFSFSEVLKKTSSKGNDFWVFTAVGGKKFFVFDKKEKDKIILGEKYSVSYETNVTERFGEQNKIITVTQVKDTETDPRV